MFADQLGMLRARRGAARRVRGSRRAARSPTSSGGTCSSSSTSAATTGGCSPPPSGRRPRARSCSPSPTAALSPLATVAKASFAVSAVGAGPFDSHVGTLALVNALVTGVAARLRTSATDRLDRVESAWQAARRARRLLYRRSAARATCVPTATPPNGMVCSRRPPRLGRGRGHARGPAARPPTRPSRPARCSPSRPSTCAAWAATCSRSCTTDARHRRPRSTRPGAPAAEPIPTALRAEGHTVMPFRGDVRSGRRCRAASTGGSRCTSASAACRSADVLAPAIALRRATASRPRRCWPRWPPARRRGRRRRTTTAEAARSAPASWSAGPAWPARCGAIAARRPRRRSTTASSATGLLALGDGEYTRRRPRHAAGRLGRRRSRVDAWGHDVWTVPPQLAGLPHARGGAWIAEGLAAARRPRRRAPGRTCSSRRRGWPGYDRLDVLHDARRRRGAARARAGSPPAAPPSTRRPQRLAAGPRRAAARSTCAPSTRDGMGVSLIQSNAAGFGAPRLVAPATRHLPAQPGHRLLARARPPGRVRRRAPPAAHPLPRARHRARRRARARSLGTMGGDSQPQVLLQLLARLLRHGSPPARDRCPRWVLGAPSSTGFNTWDNADAVRVDPRARHARLVARRAACPRGHPVVVAPTSPPGSGTRT